MRADDRDLASGPEKSSPGAAPAPVAPPEQPRHAATTTWAAGSNRLGAGGLRCRVLGGTVHPDCSQPL